MNDKETIIKGLEQNILWIKNGHKVALDNEKDFWLEKLFLLEGTIELLKGLCENEHQQGKWIECTVRGSNALRCSVCGVDSGTICETDYCPKCGARMR